jgi:cytochrome c oxidase cbb3-type subunit III
MGIEERDPHSGWLTTGHEWNGIKELNTPPPRVVYAALIITTLAAILLQVLYPAWPLGRSYTHGLLGVDQRREVAEALSQARLDHVAWTSRIESGDVGALLKDPQVMQEIRESGRRLFVDNCAACHGADARGHRGFPNLVKPAWLWGDTPEAIAQTIRVGVNSSHVESRTSQMPAFGRDGLLSKQDIAKVVAYVASLRSTPSPGVSADISSGQKIFLENCASCHGEDAKGNAEVGSRNLTDGSFLYGGDLASLTVTVYGGRQGHMPTWEQRLNPIERKTLLLYILDLRTGPQVIQKER